MSGYIKVKGHPSLARDKKTGAIVNINKEQIQSNKLRKEKLKQREDDIDNLKNEVSEIRTLLNKIIEKL